MRLRELHPGLQPFFLDLTADQFIAQRNRGVLTMLLVADTHLVPLFIVHQWQVQCAGKGTFVELDGSASVHQRHIVQEQLAVVVGVRAHRLTSDY